MDFYDATTIVSFTCNLYADFMGFIGRYSKACMVHMVPDTKSLRVPIMLNQIQLVSW